MPRDGDERTVHNRRVDGGALLGVLAVGIEIDGLGEPLVDARDVARIREKAVGGRESGAHNPAVVGCVDTTGHEASGSARDEFTKFTGKSNERGHRARAEENAGGAHDLQNERHIRWRVEIRGEVIDGAVFGMLRGEHVGDGETQRLHEVGGLVIFRAGCAGSAR